MQAKARRHRTSAVAESTDVGSGAPQGRPGRDRRGGNTAHPTARTRSRRLDRTLIHSIAIEQGPPRRSAASPMSEGCVVPLDGSGVVERLAEQFIQARRLGPGIHGLSDPARRIAMARDVAPGEQCDLRRRSAEAHVTDIASAPADHGGSLEVQAAATPSGGGRPAGRYAMAFPPRAAHRRSCHARSSARHVATRAQRPAVTSEGSSREVRLRTSESAHEQFTVQSVVPRHESRPLRRAMASQGSGRSHHAPALPVCGRHAHSATLRGGDPVAVSAVPRFTEQQSGRDQTRTVPRRGPTVRRAVRGRRRAACSRRNRVGTPQSPSQTNGSVISGTRPAAWPPPRIAAQDRDHLVDAESIRSPPRPASTWSIARGCSRGCSRRSKMISHSRCSSRRGRCRCHRAAVQGRRCSRNSVWSTGSGRARDSRIR